MEATKVLVNQGNPSSKPQQPPPIMEPTVNTPNVAMEITLTTSGQPLICEDNEHNLLDVKITSYMHGQLEKMTYVVTSVVYCSVCSIYCSAY